MQYGPETYGEQEPYIFVSYDRRNVDRALPIIRGLQSRDFRVWYDDGIETGIEWSDHIARQLENCGCVIVLATREFVNSRSCKDELIYAIYQKKPALVVFLDEMELPAGMKLQLGMLQTIFYYRYPNEEAFLNVLCSAAVLQQCRKGAVVIPPKTAAVPSKVTAEAEFRKKEDAPKPRYAFISYVRKDQEEAEQLRKLLMQSSVDTWMDTHNLPAGGNYPAEITRAIRECACFVLVLSDLAQNSAAVARETELATMKYHKPLVILQIEPLELNDAFMFYLGNQQIVQVYDIAKDSPERRKVIHSVIRNVGSD